MENNLQARQARVDAAVALKEGDRVPFAPKFGYGAYVQAAGISMYEGLMDLRNMKPGVEKILSQYDIDLYWGPAAYPSNVLEVLDSVAINWPSPDGRLSRNSGYQINDITYMDIDDYDEFLKDPSNFFMTKVYPRRHKKLKGLAKMSFQDVVEFGHYASMSAFTDPEVREALITLMSAGEQAQKWVAAQGELAQKALELQTPLGCTLGQNAPYDMLADNLRGYINVPMDLFEVPDKVLAAIDFFTDLAVKNVRGLKEQGVHYVFMPLHGGTDIMMSNEDYEKFYWPSLYRVMEEIINQGMVPYVFLEGPYNTRLEILKQVPKGKVIYMFEQVDIAKAKKILGDTACICGNLPSADLIYGKKEDIIENTKRMLDVCAPGGGFMMDCSIVIDHYDEEKFSAWYETTLEYGKY